jgi:hypothetical protein
MISFLFESEIFSDSSKRKSSWVFWEAGEGFLAISNTSFQELMIY